MGQKNAYVKGEVLSHTYRVWEKKIFGATAFVRRKKEEDLSYNIVWAFTCISNFTT